ncbi:MAG: hypothetical protein M3198_16485 [Actinomycetota bacterium]|nr:hypothetical protein [Actinomycetota bacterium]
MRGVVGAVRIFMLTGRREAAPAASLPLPDSHRLRRGRRPEETSSTTGIAGTNASEA